MCIGRNFLSIHEPDQLFECRCDMHWAYPVDFTPLNLLNSSFNPVVCNIPKKFTITPQILLVCTIIHT